MAANLEILIKAVDHASGPIGEINSELRKLDDTSTGTVGRGLAGLEKALGVGIKVAAAAAVTALAGIGVAIGKSVGAAADMEQGVADIAAVFGEAAPPVEELNRLIQDLGLDPKLKVSAVEASDAIEMLAKNGVAWEDISNGVAKSTVLLANATNDDLALAADVATNAMLQFNKTTAEMGDVVDGIIGVTQASKFDINDYALAIAQAGGVAGSVGVDFDDFNAAIAAISPSFASGSDAGTSFKTFLQRLVPSTNEAADTMRRLGLFSGLSTKEFEKLKEKISDTEAEIAALDPTSENYAEKLEKLNAKLGEQRKELVAGNSAFFDSTGNMKSMAEIAGALQQAFGGLSDSQKIEAASTIFGTDAMRAGLSLAEAGTGTIEQYKAAIGDTSAEDAAATRMNTLKGAWEIFLGVAETLSIQIGQTFLPVARDLVEWATDLASTHGPSVIKWFGELAEGIRTFVTLLREGNDPLAAFKQAFAGLIPPEVFVALDNVVNGIQAVGEFIGSTIGQFVSWQDVWTGLAVVVGVVAVNAIAGFLAAIAPVALVIGGAIAAVSLLRNAWERDWGGIQEKTRATMDYISGRFGPLLDTIKQFGGQALQEIVAWVSGNETEFQALGEIWDAAKETGRKLFEDLSNTAQTIGGKFLDWFEKQFPGAAEALKKAFEDVSQRLSELWATIQDTFNKGAEGVDGILKKLQGWWEDHGDQVKKVVDNFLKTVIAILSAAIQLMTNNLKLFFQLITGDWKGAWETIKQDAKIVWDLLKTLFGVFVDNLKLAWKMGLEDIVSKAGEKWEEVKTTVRTKLDEIVTTVTTKATAMVTGFTTGLANFATTVGQKINEVITAITTPFAGIYEKMKGFGENIISGFKAGLEAKWEELRQRIADLGNLVPQSVKDLLKIQSPSRVTMQLGEQVAAGFGLGIERGQGLVIAKATKIAEIAANYTAGVIQSIRQAGAQGMAGELKSQLSLAQLKATQMAETAARALQGSMQSLSDSQKAANLAIAAGVMPTGNTQQDWRAMIAANLAASRPAANNFNVYVTSTGDAVRDVRNQVELYNLAYGSAS